MTQQETNKIERALKKLHIGTRREVIIQLGQAFKTAVDKSLFDQLSGLEFDLVWSHMKALIMEKLEKS